MSANMAVEQFQKSEGGIQPDQMPKCWEKSPKAKHLWIFNLVMTDAFDLLHN